jgi:hypothetical protein
MQPGDFARLMAVQAAFLHLLTAAEEPGQLEVLGRLLAGVWRDGDAFLSPEVHPWDVCLARAFCRVSEVADCSKSPSWARLEFALAGGGLFLSP